MDFTFIQICMNSVFCVISLEFSGDGMLWNEQQTFSKQFNSVKRNILQNKKITTNEQKHNKKQNKKTKQKKLASLKKKMS